MSKSAITSIVESLNEELSPAASSPFAGFIAEIGVQRALELVNLTWSRAFAKSPHRVGFSVTEAGGQMTFAFVVTAASAVHSSAWGPSGTDLGTMALRQHRDAAGSTSDPQGETAATAVDAAEFSA